MAARAPGPRGHPPTTGPATGPAAGPAPGADGDPAGESGVGWALGLLFRCYVRTVDQVVGELPGGPRGYSLLATVDRLPPRSQLALAARLGIDRTVLTYLLDALAGAGLVQRQPDPADRRARGIVATPAGRELLARLEGQVRAAEEQVLAGLDPAERSVFRVLLRRCAQYARSADPAATACDAAENIRSMDAGTPASASAPANRAAGG